MESCDNKPPYVLFAVGWQATLASDFKKLRVVETKSGSKLP